MSGKILTICSSKGGVGKSATAVNFAIDAAKTGKKVLLADAERSGTTIDYEAHREEENLHIMNGYNLSFIKMLDGYRDIYDLIIIDTAGVNAEIVSGEDNLQEVINRKIFSKSDFLLIPVEPSPVTIRKLVRFVGDIEEYIEVSRGHLKALMFLNKAHKNGVITRQVMNGLDGAFSIPLSKNKIRLADDIKKAEGGFKSVNEFAPNSEVSFDMRKLQKEVFKLMEV